MDGKVKKKKDKSIKAEEGHSSYSPAFLWYAGCLSGRGLQLSAVNNSKAGVHVCLHYMLSFSHTWCFLLE